MTDSAISQVLAHQPASWINPYRVSADAVNPLCDLIVSEEQIRDAENRLRRFAPLIEALFPETTPSHGIIESPLREIPAMQKELDDKIIGLGKLGAKIVGREYWGTHYYQDMPIDHSPSFFRSSAGGAFSVRS